MCVLTNWQCLLTRGLIGERGTVLVRRFSAGGTTAQNYKTDQPTDSSESTMAQNTDVMSTSKSYETMTNQVSENLLRFKSFQSKLSELSAV